MGVPKLIKGRYEIRQILGEGGMGVVYHAYDSVVKRSVALKTVRDTPSRTALDLFYKECAVLASFSHPNIVEIFDLGEFEDDGAGRPYFVMPLLSGSTLAELIDAKSSRINVGRVIDIMSQACRGLQAAHERGLVHRDLKPSNIFVLDDDSVKIIDFGIARTIDAQSTAGQKGTLLYMSPEQVDLQVPTPLSDIFAAGVVAYEAMSLRHPFERGSAAQVASAIKTHIPPPVSELNPLVNASISRVIHKAMAKQPWYRFASARELSECLQKAAHNQPIEIFDPGRIQPGIERARKAFQQGDYPFADEILTELEVQGYCDEGISTLRRCLNDAQRRKMIDQLLESARTRAAQQEYPLALQKLQELLALEPAHAGALELKSSIESKRSEQKVDDWFRLAHQHIQQNAFGHARQALQNVLQLRPADSQAVRLLADVDRREQEFVRLRQEQDQLYSNAMEAWQNGEISVALSKLERLIGLDSQPSQSAEPERSATFQNFYNQVRSEHDAMKGAYELARKHLTDGNLDAALEICEQQQALHPGQALFQSMKFDIEERQRQELSRRIAEADRRVESEPDLDKRVAILLEAVERNPGEPHFERALRTAREKRDLVNSIVGKARNYEDRAQYSDALGQWEIVRTIYAPYPGLDFEMERVRRRQEQQVRSDAKAKWVEQIDWRLGAADYPGAIELSKAALAEFPEDAELLELEKLAAQALARVDEAQRLLNQAQELCTQQRFADAIELLRKAHQADAGSAPIRAALTALLLTEARTSFTSDWRGAEALVQEALQLDPDNAEAKSLRTLALDRKREEFVSRCATQVRRLQAEGQVQPAIEHVKEALCEYPADARLLQLCASLMRAHPEVLPAAAEAQNTQTLDSPIAPAAPADTTVDLRPPEVPAPATVPPSPPPHKPGALLLLTAAAVAIILLAGAVFRVTHTKRPPPVLPARTSSRAEIVPAPIVAPPPGKTTLLIYADLDAGRVVLDDQPAGELRDGRAMLDLDPGAHSLKIGGFREQATITFQIADNAAPVVRSVLAKEASAVTVASMGGQAWVHPDRSDLKVTLDGSAAGAPNEAGFQIDGVMPGPHEIALGEGKIRRTVTWSMEAGPVLTVFLKSDRNVGTIVVSTGESGVRVWVNGKEQPVKTQDGRLRIPGVDAGRYSVRVAKDGFMDAPEQQVSIKKGEEMKLEFQLRPVPGVASLSITDGVPGTEVLLDQASIGFIREDGGFSGAGIAPGDHTIDLRKQFYRPRKLEKHFEGGGTVPLGGAEAGLEKLPGTIRPKLTPADMRITISRGGGAPEPFSGSPLPEGTYTLTGHAPGYVDRSVIFSVAPGETKEPELVLERVAPTPSRPADMLSQWDDPAGWNFANDWYVHRGGNFVGFKPARTNGTFEFKIRLDKGRRLQWVAARTDDRNYALFQMDKKTFYRSRFVNGKETPVTKSAHPLEKQAIYTIQIEITDDVIIHRYNDGSRWIVLDEWREPGGKFASGKFGFLLPGGDTIGISGFSFKSK